jgi:hypothetical protein
MVHGQTAFQFLKNWLIVRIYKENMAPNAANIYQGKGNNMVQHRMA